MTDFRISCTTKTMATDRSHGHIVGVGIAGLDGTYSVAGVYQSMDSGNRFYTMSPSTNRVAMVAKATCCGVRTLRTSADAIADNNLDNLPRC